MLNSIVGPAVKGVADFASPQKDAKNSGSDSFGKVLKEKDSLSGEKDQARMREKVEPNKAADSPRTVQDRQKPQESERKRPEIEKAKAKSEDGPEKKVKGNSQRGSQREQAISKFMDSFESEFGVPPTRIVEAMANLKVDELAQSPEETADQVISQLDLEDQDQDAAKSMYIGLLAQLGQMEKTPALPPKPEMSLGLGSQERFQDVQQQRGALNQSLQSMNEKFWMSGDSATTGKADATQGFGQTPGELDASSSGMSELQKQIQANPDFKIDATKLNPEMQRALQAVKEANPTASPEVALAALVAAARAQQAKAAGELSSDSAEGNEASEALSALEGGMPKSADQAGNDNGVQAPIANPDSLQAVDGQVPGRRSGQQFSQQGGQQSEYGMSAKSTKSEVASKDKNAKSDFDSTLRMSGVPVPAPLKDLGLPTAASIGANANTPGAAGASNLEQADIRQIMNQAQYLIKKGGGEMKVEMTPEGMGKIQMKVLVENGKVNVQMSAETHEAKKVLEGGLSELKNSLAAHQLSMDHIKVDVVNHTNTDNTAQNQMNQNNPGSREQTRQFWNHFSENFGSPSQQRENFTEIPSMRGYARPRTDKQFEPVRSARVAGYGAEGKGKGLNLVA